MSEKMIKKFSALLTAAVMVTAVLSSVAIFLPTASAQQQQPTQPPQQQPGYFYPYPPMNNNTNPNPPTGNNTMPNPPDDNGTIPNPPDDNGTIPLPPIENNTQGDDASIFISAKTIHSVMIHDNIEGVRVLPPAPGFNWSGNILWSATGNVTLIAVLSDGSTSVSEAASSSALHFEAQALEFQSVNGQPLDVTYSLQANLVEIPTNSTG